MPIQLRPYQIDLIDRVRGAFKAGFRAPLIVLSTGGGKTLITGEILRGLISKGGTGWWIEHRDELIEQSSKKFTSMGIPHSIIARGQTGNIHNQLQIASIGTLVRRLDYLPRPSLLAIDEAHHTPAASWDKIISTYPNVPRIGLTATPCRLDGKGLGKYFDTIIEGPSIRELIDWGFLADYILMAAPAAMDESKLKMRAGDITAESQLAAVDRPKRVGDIVEHYKSVALGRKAICFAINIEDSLQIVEAFINSGVNAAHVDGTTEVNKRRKIFQAFQDGKIDVISNVALFDEGLHIEGVTCIIHGRRTASLTRYMQATGRGLAAKPNGEVTLILDHAGNSGTVDAGGRFVPRHGLPDEPREWTLADTPKRKKDTEPSLSVRLCPKCQAAQSAAVRICKFCGYHFAPQTEPIRVEAGTLVVVSRAEAKIQAAAERARIAEEKRIAKELQADLDRRRRAEEKQARIAEEKACATVEELAELGRQRGYKYPRHWAERRWVFIRPRGNIPPVQLPE